MRLAHRRLRLFRASRCPLRRILVVVSSIVLFACGAPRSGDPPALPSASGSAKSDPPRSKLLVTEHEVRFEGDDAAVFPLNGDSRNGADPALKLNGADDFFIKPFGEALTKRRSKGLQGDDLHLAVAPAVSYRLVLELLFTAGRMNVKSFDLEDTGLAKTFHVGAPVDVPGVPPSTDARLDFALLFSGDGIEMTISGKNVQPGCDHHPLSFGPHMTFLKVGGQVDLSAVSACSEKAKKTEASLASTDVVTLVASAKDPPTFGEIARVAVTERPLFSDLRLAMVP